MNPLLLKPCSDQTSQVVLNGKPIGNRDAWDYFRGKGFETLRTEVCAAYDRLASRYNPIVLEGAGSISEINLRDKDLVNLPMPAMPVPMYSWWPTLTVAAYLPVHTVPLSFRSRKTGSASRE